MPASKETMAASLLASFAAGSRQETPYRHWLLTDCIGQDVVDDLNALPFPAPALDGVSGKREIHNATRRYFDAENRGRHGIVAAFADALQDQQVTADISRRFGIDLAGTYLRLEYAQDTDGFWLEPHTDLGVKAFTMLLYLSREPSHAGLGTDIYDAGKHHVGRSPFVPGGALVFIPSNDTYHGFEPKPIEGIRKSIIINYVTDAWRAREQLSFPEAPIRG